MTHRSLSRELSHPLTAVELNRMFLEPRTARFNVLLESFLQRGSASPDGALVQLFTRFQGKEDLIPLALILRAGANPNMYVNMPQVGTVHLLGFSSLSLQKYGDPSVITTVILLLVASGARWVMPMFEGSAGLSVKQWLEEQGYDTIFGALEVGLMKAVEPGTLTNLGILLDQKDLISGPLGERQLDLVIRSRSIKAFPKDEELRKILGGERPFSTDPPEILACVTYLNSEAFIKLINALGVIPSYILMNQIILSLRAEPPASASQQELLKMLLTAVSRGSTLDEDQLALLQPLGPSVLNPLLQEYQQPYWKKVCSPSNAPEISSSPTPAPFQKTAFALGLDPRLPKNYLCQSLQALSQVDPIKLREAAYRRQQLLVDSALGTLPEFAQGKAPNLICRNKSLLPVDPFFYNDWDLAYYRDVQGVIWCFTSDKYEELLRSKVNPYSKEELPVSFLESVEYKRGVLLRLGIIDLSKPPPTFESGLVALTAKDTINNQESDRVVEIFLQAAKTYGVSEETLRGLSPEQMATAVTKSFDLPLGFSLISLIPSHAFRTLAHLVLILTAGDPSHLQTFFDQFSLPVRPTPARSY